MPEKLAAKGGGLSVSVDDLAPLDWVGTDLMSVQDKEAEEARAVQDRPGGPHQGDRRTVEHLVEKPGPARAHGGSDPVIISNQSYDRADKVQAYVMQDQRNDGWVHYYHRGPRSRSVGSAE